MRILQISNYYAPELGGIEKIAQAISSSIEDKSQIRVVCFTHQKKSRTDEIEGVRIRRIGTQLNAFSQQLSVHAYTIIKKEIKDFVPDVIIIHLPNPFLAAIILRIIPKNVKLIAYWHSDIVKQKIGEKIFHGLTVRLLRRAQVIIATSPNYVEGSNYLSMFKDKCRVVPNCIEENALVIDEDTETIVEKLRKQYEGKTLCVCVGRQVPYKGFEYAVQAFSLLDDSSYELVLIGREGESTPKIKQLSTGMSNIKMIGEADFKTLKAYLSACDIFCFPSITKNEAFGIALAEGMYFGKPAITFTIPGSGVNYVNIHMQTGIEVPNRDVKAYADAVRFLAEQEDKREEYGEAAGKRVRELFLLSQYSANILQVLSTV